MTLLFDRREFLKSLGIISGTAVVSCNRMAPEETLSAYLTPPAEMVPGVAAYYATVCRACPAGCGILVKTREGRPIKLEGNPVHPVNEGKLCARGQAFIQGLYSRQRIRAPLVRKKGRLEAVSWDEALRLVAAKVKQARSYGLVTGLESGAFDDLIGDFTRGFSEAIHLRLEPGVPTSLGAAASMMFGRPEIPRIDLSPVRHIVSLGADFLDTWISPVEFSRQWAAGHGLVAGRTMEMDYIGPRRDLTAIAADRWFPAAVGELGRIALLLAYDVFARKKETLSGEEVSGIQKMLSSLGPRPRPESLPQAELEGIVDRLTRSELGLLLAGGAAMTGPTATAAHAASLLVNYLLGAVGSALRFGEAHALDKVSPERDIAELLERRAQGDLDLLFVHGANPAYSLPQGEVTGATKDGGSGLTVVLASELDETADGADVVLPVHHPLESWGDYALTSNIQGLMQPVRAPLYQTRHVGDVFVDLAARSGRPVKWNSYKEYLVKRWATISGVLPLKKPQAILSDAGVPAEQDGGVGPSAIDPPHDTSAGGFEQMLVAGGRFHAPTSLPRTTFRLARNVSVPAIQTKAADQKAEQKGYDLLVPFSVGLYDGRAATQEWLREVPDPITQTAWEIPLEVAPDVAQAHALTDGDIVTLKKDGHTATARVVIEGGLFPRTLALRPGGGRSLARESDQTCNPWRLLGRDFDSISGELARAGTQVGLEKVRSENIVSVMGSPDSEGRLLHLSMGLDDYRKKRFPVLTRHGEVAPGSKGHGGQDPIPLPMPHQEEGGTRPGDNMYSLQEHTHHRWGMVIDLDKCIGCSACAVACYAENNIPVVGKPEVALGRELSWIRIEKHVFGQGRDERVRFLPVMCQQCDNAPCETVCPVFAASHTTDGLNAQIYNRCIGTRYCSNNCPYKVRRFNYFDYQRQKPANQQLNPDVTVRSRGVMEKCTFCIQRIREVQNRHKAEGTPLGDGEIVPACVQTCPTGALVFGDFKNQEWIMSTLARDPRGYRLLDYISNTRPGVVYLRKVDTVTTSKG